MKVASNAQWFCINGEEYTVRGDSRNKSYEDENEIIVIGTTSISSSYSSGSEKSDFLNSNDSINDFADNDIIPDEGPRSLAQKKSHESDSDEDHS